jgi:hypothetical protein
MTIKARTLPRTRKALSRVDVTRLERLLLDDSRRFAGVMCSARLGRSAEFNVESAGLLGACGECKGVQILASSTSAGSDSMLLIIFIEEEVMALVVAVVVVVVIAVVATGVGLANTILRKSWNLASASCIRVWAF